MIYCETLLEILLIKLDATPCNFLQIPTILDRFVYGIILIHLPESSLPHFILFFVYGMRDLIIVSSAFSLCLWDFHLLLCALTIVIFTGGAAESLKCVVLHFAGQ